jgi:two-component system, OmpR family, response regulator
MQTWIDEHNGVWIDDGGLLHHGQGWVALPDIEWRLMELLVARIGQLVRREELTAAGWPDGHSGTSALNVRMTKVRKRLQPLGLTITTVRGRGYVLVTSS